MVNIRSKVANHTFGGTLPSDDAKAESRESDSRPLWRSKERVSSRHSFGKGRSTMLLSVRAKVIARAARKNESMRRQGHGIRIVSESSRAASPMARRKYSDVKILPYRKGGRLMVRKVEEGMIRLWNRSYNDNPWVAK